MGFAKIAEHAHDGYDHPTLITMRKHLTDLRYDGERGFNMTSIEDGASIAGGSRAMRRGVRAAAGERQREAARSVP